MGQKNSGTGEFEKQSEKLLVGLVCMDLLGSMHL